MTAQAGDTFSSKAQLRQELRQLRKSLAPAFRRSAARRAALRLLRVPELARARRIAIYLSCGSELDTAPLLAACLRRRLRVYVPRVMRDGSMRFLEITRFTALRRNRHGIREPVAGAHACALAQLDVVVQPLLGFDAQGHRLGSGAGYYDRALARLAGRRKPRRIGLAFAAQEARLIPADPWDVRLHVLVTEQGVRRWPIG